MTNDCAFSLYNSYNGIGAILNFNSKKIRSIKITFKK